MISCIYIEKLIYDFCLQPTLDCSIFCPGLQIQKRYNYAEHAIEKVRTGLRLSVHTRTSSVLGVPLVGSVAGIKQFQAFETQPKFDW
jgi:hypothetical protein